MTNLLADKILLRFLLIAIVLGMAFQTIFYFNHQPVWLLVAMWMPTVAVFCLGQAGLSVLRELKKFPLRWVALAVLLALFPYALNQLFYAIFDLGNWNPSFVLAPDGSGISRIDNANLVLGSQSQGFFFFALNLALSVLVGSIMTTLVGALGEEIGWRGFLQIRLGQHLSAFNATALLALLWAYWHIPANLGGTNGKVNIALITFVIFPAGVFFMTFVLGWLRLSSNAIWPCAIFHGVNNTVSGIHLLKPRSDLIENWIGLLSYALVGSIFVLLIYRKDRIEDPREPLR